MPDDASLEVLLDYLKGTRGFDFTGYKRTTLQRRVAKRLEAVGVASYGDYVDYLEVHPEEFAFLFNTVLVNVTGFFRDPPSWEYLGAEVVPRLLEASSDGPLRVWCAGCASGEETYSLAMALADALGENDYLERVKIYSTDVDEAALTEARHATYSAAAVEAVPSELRERFFERVEQRYAFRKELRRNVIFGRNDLVQDAPISRIDLLTCRNTLMYFNAETQSQILRRFHFALNNWGFLYLGKSEMLVTHAELFKPVSLRRRVFTKVLRPSLHERFGFALPAPAPMGSDLRPGSAAREEAFDAAPVAQVAVDADGNLILANENARVLFGLAIDDLGRPLKDLEISYRPVDLRSNIELAHADHRVVSVQHVAIATASGEPREFDVLITPLYSGDRALGTTITFADVTVQRRLKSQLEGSKHEVETAYQELQCTVEELETTNEELHSTNEELETTNEELQSSNEELETMNEELQSTNEELQTINEELRHRSDELDEVNAFLETILTSMGLAVAVVDRNLTVRAWNSGSTDLWGVRPDEAEGQHLLGLDVGLPVERLKMPLRKILRDGQDRLELVLESTNRRGRTIDCKIVVLSFSADGDEARGAILIMEELQPPAAG
jgi:two-component system, chemotaxis family, CheB/CheR fusion protein